MRHRSGSFLYLIASIECYTSSSAFESEVFRFTKLKIVKVAYEMH